MSACQTGSLLSRVWWIFNSLWKILKWLAQHYQNKHTLYYILFLKDSFCLQRFYCQATHKLFIFSPLMIFYQSLHQSIIYTMFHQWLCSIDICRKPTYCLKNTIGAQPLRIYRTCAIITHGLYTFYPLFEVHLI